MGRRDIMKKQGFIFNLFFVCNAVVIYKISFDFDRIGDRFLLYGSRLNKMGSDYDNLCLFMVAYIDLYMH